MAQTPRGPDTRQKDRVRSRRRDLRRDLEAMRASARADAGGQTAQADADTDHFNEKELQRARRLVYEGRAWIRENPSAWAYMVSLAQKDVAANRRVSVAGLVHATRAKDFTSASGKGTAISNSLEPVLSRLILLAVPGSSKVVERRRTPVDAVLQDEVIGYELA